LYYFDLRRELGSLYSLEVLMRPIPFPILLADRQPHIVRAHRMRGAVVATLIRDLARWISAAAR
jgi:hypothetical protein